MLGGIALLNVLQLGKDTLGGLLAAVRARRRHALPAGLLGQQIFRVANAHILATLGKRALDSDILGDAFAHVFGDASAAVLVTTEREKEDEE